MWRTCLILRVLGVLLLSLPLGSPASGAAAGSLTSSPVGSSRLQTARGTTAGASGPLFIENVGQWDEAARFQVLGGDRTLWLAEDGLWITILDPTSASGPITPALGPVPDQGAEGVEPPQPARVHLHVSFPGADPHPLLEPVSRAETKISYLIGNDRDAWHVDVPVWRGVRYADLYPGIDLEVSSDGASASLRMVAREGADPGAVRLRVEGAESLSLDGDRLTLQTAFGAYSLPLLELQSVEDRASLSGNAEVTGEEVWRPFALAQTPRAEQPVDMPSDLLYAYSLGTEGRAHGIDVDAAGHAYVSGHASSQAFPSGPGYDTTHNGWADAFVCKLRADGTGLVYGTFLGGAANDTGERIAVDSTGQAYLTGNTLSADFPVGPGYDGSFNGDPQSYVGDAFVLKLGADGTDLVYSTFLGGSSGDHGYGIAVDGAGHAYVSGSTGSVDFPVGPGYDTILGATDEWQGDAFVVKLNAEGTALVYSTYLGGSTGSEVAYGISVDAVGHAYVTGATYSADFPVGPGYDTSGPSVTYRGSDAFVTKLSPSGMHLVYSTFLGGEDDGDAGTGVAVDASGQAYVTGYTSSDLFPVGPGLDTVLGGPTDAFVAKLDASGTALVYSTYLGGSDSDSGSAIQVDGTGNAYVTGGTLSADFPTGPGYDTGYNGGYSSGRIRNRGDAFVAKLGAEGTMLVYSSYLGGSQVDACTDIAIDTGGRAYLAGYAQSSDAPGGPGVFVAKFGLGVETGETTLVRGTVRVWDAAHGRAVPLRGARVELLRYGNVVDEAFTGDGTTAPPGDYAFHVSTSAPQVYSVRVTLTHGDGQGDYAVRYMPATAGQVPWIERDMAGLREPFRRDIVFSEAAVRAGATTNLPESAWEYLDDLALIYAHTEQAMRFARESLGIAGLRSLEVRAFDPSIGIGSVYLPAEDAVVLSAAASLAESPGRPQNGVWHEVLHHAMSETILRGLAYPASCGPHAGFLNTTTADSWAEGWAIFWAAVMADTLPDVPYGHGGWYLSLSLDANYQPWDAIGGAGTAHQREDVAAASLLWDLYDAESSADADADQDHLALGLEGLRDRLLRPDGSGGYLPLGTVREVYREILAGPEDDVLVDEVFRAHGFFGDRGWGLFDCRVLSEGNRVWEPGEAVGDGGSDGRPSLPLVEGANLCTALQDESGAPLPWGVVGVTYRYPELGSSHTLMTPVTSGGLLYLEPPPPRIGAVVEVRGNSPHSDVYTVTNAEYWDAVAGSTGECVAEVTLTIRRVNQYLPLINR